MAQASQAARGVARPSQSATLARWVGIALVAVVIVLGLVFTIYPFIFMLGGTLKTNKEIFSLPPTILPPTWQFQNWPGPIRRHKLCALASQQRDCGRDPAAR